MGGTQKVYPDPFSNIDLALAHARKVRRVEGGDGNGRPSGAES